jgi:hypothetical protein
MLKKILLPLLLIFSIPLGESHILFKTPYKNEKSWFLLTDIKQAVTWYAKDTSEALIWIIFLWVWYTRERKRNKFWKCLILLFLIFRTIDLLCYWLNHRHAGIIYGLCYLSIIIYAGYSSIKEHRKNRR